MNLSPGNVKFFVFSQPPGPGKEEGYETLSVDDEDSLKRETPTGQAAGTGSKLV